MSEGMFTNSSHVAAREIIQISPTRLLLAYLNGKQIKIAAAAQVLKMDPNELRGICLSTDRETSAVQAKLILRLRRTYG